MSAGERVARKLVANSRSVTGRFYDAVVEPLASSASPNDRRKGRDLKQLLAMQEGVWSGRFRLLGAGPGPQRTLCVSVQLRAPGLIWDGTTQLHDLWQMILAIPNNYPLAAPAVGFAEGPTPFNAHVLHKDFVPQPNGLPAELQQFLADGHDGSCCYALASDWTPRLNHNLVLVVRHVSRILTGAKLFGERYGLNPQARDCYLGLKQQGRLPLGPALPLSFDRAAGRGVDSPTPSEPDEDTIEWIELEDHPTGGQ